MFVSDLADPDDTSGLDALFDSGVDPKSVVAVIGKTIGDGLHDDLGRGLTERTVLELLGSRTGTTAQDVAMHVPVILSGGAVGAITPHLTVVTRTVDEMATPSSPDGRLVVRTAISADIAPEEIGRMEHVSKVEAAVRNAIEQFPPDDPVIVHCVLLKGPSLTQEKLVDARARGKRVVTEELAPGVRGIGEYSNDASCLGVALALGEVSSDELTEEAIRSRWDLYSELAHASCGGEKSRVEICLLANSQSASGGLRIGHAIADTLVASGGIKDALRSAGLSFDCCPSTSQLDQVIQAFAHPVIPHSGQLLGKSTTLWEDPQAIKTAKSVVGGIVAGVLGKTSIYVSGGERNSHQGPPGGYPVAAVIKCDS